MCPYGYTVCARQTWGLYCTIPIRLRVAVEHIVGPLRGYHIIILESMHRQKKLHGAFGRIRYPCGF